KRDTPALYRILTEVEVPVWRSEMVLQQQTAFRTERVLVSNPALPTAAFANESLRAGDAVTMLAGRDVSLSGLTRATEADGVVQIAAGRDVLLDGALPTEASAPAGEHANVLAAVADIRAGLKVDVRGGRYVDMRANAILKADDNNPSTSNGVIRLDAGKTLFVRSDAFGGHEVYLYSGGDVELRAKLDSGHLIDVRAGLGPDGIGSVITDINADLATSGSEIHIFAGPNGGNLLLNDSQIYTAGPISLSAPAGALINTGGWILADTMVATARDGISGQIDVRTLYATITGVGDLALTTFGDVTLANVSVANGSIDLQGCGSVVADIVQALGGTGNVTLGSYAGNLTLGMIQAAGTFSAQANVGEIQQSPGGSITAADVSFTGEMPPNLNLSANELVIVAYQP
ncbi:MAG TPA: hypothetical protein PLV92_26990, partial [Pirellulaceae bacterium]|nr:hypothetical protein [Pirellulaceae bacterium]